MRKSCLSGLILLAAILLAISFALQRCFIASSPPATSHNPSATPTLSEAQPPLTTVPTTLAAPFPTPQTRPYYEERIPGLYIQAVFPLDPQIAEVGGLTARDGKWYLTGIDAAHTPYLWEIDPLRNTIERQVPLQEPGQAVPCGISASPLLWTCLSGQGTILLGLDQTTLTAQTRVPFTDTLQAIAPVKEGWFGVDRSGERLYLLGHDGTVLRARTSGTGVSYRDCEAVREGIVCTGPTETGNSALDVIDPSSLSLVARYPIDLRAPDGTWAKSYAIAFDGEYFLLVIQGAWLEIRAYHLDGRMLEEFVPTLE